MRSGAFVDLAGLLFIGALAACAASVAPPEPPAPPSIPAPGTAPPCSGGATWNGSECRAPQLVATNESSSVEPTPPNESNVAVLATKVGPPTLSEVLHARRRPWLLAPKSSALLVAEIQGLEAVFAQTEKTAVDRPTWIRRLADTYAELESAAHLARSFSSTRDDGARDEKVESASRKQAIRYYTMLKNEYPKWCVSPDPANPQKSKGCADETLAFLGYEHERGGAYDDARKVYLELIQAWPTSAQIPDAYLSFGDLYADQAATDPGLLSLAAQSYGQVLKYPPPDNQLFGYAEYRLGLVLASQGDAKQAAASFKKAIEWAKAYPTLPAAAEIALAAKAASSAPTKP